MKQLLISFVLFFIIEVKAQQPVPYAPELFDPAVSSGVCGFSADGKRIYFTRQDKDTKKQLIYQARKKNRWVEPVLMPFSGKSNDVGGRLSSDGNFFYFTSDRANGSDKPGDEWNIWVSEKRGESWGEPIALRELNNKGMECCPLPLDKNRIMFSADRDRAHAWWISVYDLQTKSEVFVDSLNGDRLWQWPSAFVDSDVLLLNSMMRKDSKGMDDIYISFLKNGRWSIPVNVGEPVNTNIYEDGAMLTPDKKWLIYSQHDTPESPSRVMAVPWKPICDRLQKSKVK
jgi:WD40-like Beta Propeller Repeat